MISFSENNNDIISKGIIFEIISLGIIMILFFENDNVESFSKE